jgi:hypothetical protein
MLQLYFAEKYMCLVRGVDQGFHWHDIKYSYYPFILNFREEGKWEFCLRISCLKTYKLEHIKL